MILNAWVFFVNLKTQFCNCIELVLLGMLIDNINLLIHDINLTKRYKWYVKLKLNDK